MSTNFVIETTGLTRRFGKLVAVEDLALQVPAYSVYGFLGPNGAGKTTTICMLLGLLRPNAGEVRLFGEPLARGRGKLLARVGALVEAPSLYPHLTGEENLEIVCRLIGARRALVGRALETVRLQDAARRVVGQYSQGMRQRLGLAVALLNEPELLILDEPTNGLDPAGIHEMRELICRLPEEHGVTVFLSSHLLGEIEQVATHIGIVGKGRMLFQGPPEQLQARLQEEIQIGVDQREMALRVLANAGWAVHPNGNGRLHVAANGKSDAALLNAQLVKAGINVFHLSLEQPSLEDIFLKLTQ